MYGTLATLFSLEEYWETLQISECQAYGIRNVPDEVTTGCDDYWQQRERYWLSFAIDKAEKAITTDTWLGFPLRRKYYETTTLPYKNPNYLAKYLQGIGVETETLVEQVNITLSSAGSPIDPVTITTTVDFTDTNEIIIKYPEAYWTGNCDGYTIRPSCVEISGTTATIEIPRCRLLKPDYFKDYDQITDRPDYTDDTYFLDTVDVYRNYLDTTDGADLVWLRTKSQIERGCDTLFAFGSTPTVGNITTQGAVARVVNGRDGTFYLEPATYTAATNTWTRNSFSVQTRLPDQVRVSYMRGKWDRYEQVDSDVIRALISVAHNNLPQDYCTCSVQQRYHEDDNRPLEPPVSLGLGPSTWGIYEAVNLLKRHDATRNSHFGGGLF